MALFIRIKSKSKLPFSRGFSLTELLVVLGIIGVMSTLILANIATLSSRARVDAATKKILDTLKEIRHKSVSVREFKNNLFPSYGMYLDINYPRRIIIYADCVVDDNGDDYIDDKDKFYYDPSSTDCGGGNGFVEEITLDKQVRIKEIRSYSGETKKIEPKIYMEYVRPEPTFWVSNADLKVMTFKKIEIDISDIRDRFKRTIIIWTTGQFAEKE